jgi:hypothetical protein
MVLTNSCRKTGVIGNYEGSANLLGFSMSRVGWCEISSAVSAVLRGDNFSCSDAVDAEQCGYGDLQ